MHVINDVPEKESLGTAELHDLQIEQCGVGILVDSEVRVLFKNLHVLNCRLGMLVGSLVERVDIRPWSDFSAK